MSLSKIFEATTEDEAAEAISAMVPIYENLIHENIRGNTLSLWDRFLLEAASRGSVPVVKACLENGADVNCATDKNHGIVLAVLDHWAQAPK